VWRGLLSGRWDVVDHFDADGRRFIIGRRCPSAQAAPVARLSDRERAACSAAAFGQSNKVIAAEMGIALSTAGMLLLRATRKLRRIVGGSYLSRPGEAIATSVIV
jgi:DNA-binding CsgD family transcriptional regulator